MRTKPITPATLLQRYQSFRKKLSRKKQNFDYHSLPQGGFIVDPGTPDSFFSTNENYVALHLDRQHFHLRPEGVLYLVQLEGVAKNLFLFIIAHILDKNMEFRWSAMEKTDFQDWCVIVGVHKPKENTIVDAKKLLVEKNVIMNLERGLWMVNPMIITPKEASEERVLLNYVTRGIEKLVRKNKPFTNFVFEFLFPKETKGKSASKKASLTGAPFLKAS